MMLGRLIRESMRQDLAMNKHMGCASRGVSPGANRLDGWGDINICWFLDVHFDGGLAMIPWR